RARLPALLGEGRYNRIGIGIDAEGQNVRIVIALGESYVRVEKVPRVVRAGASFALRGVLRDPYRAPDVMVTAPSGKVERPALVREGASFRAMVACTGAPGRHQVEV